MKAQAEAAALVAAAAAAATRTVAASAAAARTAGAAWVRREGGEGRSTAAGATSGAAEAEAGVMAGVAALVAAVATVAAVTTRAAARAATRAAARAAMQAAVRAAMRAAARAAMRAAARAAQCPPSAAPRRVRGEVAPARPGSLAIRGGSARPGLEPGPRRVAAMLATRLSRQPIHLQITQIARKHVAARARCRARERSPKARRSTHERETRGAGTDCDSALAHATLEHGRSHDTNISEARRFPHDVWMPDVWDP